MANSRTSRSANGRRGRATACGPAVSRPRCCAPPSAHELPRDQPRVVGMREDRRRQQRRASPLAAIASAVSTASPRRRCPPDSGGCRGNVDAAAHSVTRLDRDQRMARELPPGDRRCRATQVAVGQSPAGGRARIHARRARRCAPAAFPRRSRPLAETFSTTARAPQSSMATFTSGYRFEVAAQGFGHQRLRDGGRGRDAHAPAPARASSACQCRAHRVSASTALGVADGLVRGLGALQRNAWWRSNRRTPSRASSSRSSTLTAGCVSDSAAAALDSWRCDTRPRTRAAAAPRRTPRIDTVFL